MVIQTVLYTLGIFALIKGLIVLVCNKSIVHWALKLAKNKNSIRNMAILEIVIAIILLTVGYYIKLN